MVVESTLTPSIPNAGGIDADLQPGQVVGEYQVEHKLGQGGFGAVFKAAHPLIGKLVAIKVLSQRFSVDPQMVSRFIAEARAVNQIRHHNIIDIFSFGTLDDGRMYYVMEYLEGEPLDRRLARRGPMSLADALPILRAIGRALDAAHAKGIAHRDLKAENVFLAAHPDGVYTKLLDFGIAKLMAPEDEVSHKTRTGAPMGTPHYMSPEQCHGRAVDHRTDMYAFGVLAYVMLTGVYPLDGDDYMTILMRQVHDDPLPPSSHRPELPVGVNATIAWLMRKEPASRPETLLAAVSMLEQVAAGDPNAAVPPPFSAKSDSLSTLPVEGGKAGARKAVGAGGKAAGAAEARSLGELGTLPSVEPAGAPEGGASGSRTGERSQPPLGERTPQGLVAAAVSGTGSGELPAAALDESGARPGGGKRAGSEAVTARSGKRAGSDEASARRGQGAGESAARRWLAPHVLLGGGAVLAAIAVVAVMAVRSGKGSAAQVPGTAPPDAAETAGAPGATAAAPTDPPDAAVAAAAPDAAAPVQRADVYLTIEGPPPHTEVRRGGLLLGTVPGRVQLSRSDAEVMLVLSADGYVPASVVVVPTEDLARTVTLQPKAGAVRPRPGGTVRPRPGAGSAPPAAGSAGEPTNDIEEFPPKPKPANP